MECGSCLWASDFLTQNPRSRGTCPGAGGNELGQTCPCKTHGKGSGTDASEIRGSLLSLMCYGSYCLRNQFGNESHAAQCHRRRGQMLPMFPYVPLAHVVPRGHTGPGPPPGAAPTPLGGRAAPEQL